MTNDAKLGLLAGVAGVVAAAVFHRPSVDPPLPPAQAAVAVQSTAPPRVAGAVPSPRATPRAEIDARPVSRTVEDDD